MDSRTAASDDDLSALSMPPTEITSTARLTLSAFLTQNGPGAHSLCSEHQFAWSNQDTENSQVGSVFRQQLARLNADSMGIAFRHTISQVQKYSKRRKHPLQP